MNKTTKAYLKVVPEIPTGLKRQAPHHTTLLIGPPRIYDNDKWQIIMATGCAGDEPWITGFDLNCEYQRPRRPRKPDCLTTTETKLIQRAIASAARSHFDSVLPFDLEITMGEQLHQLFPCPKSARILADMEANPSQADRLDSAHRRTFKIALGYSAEFIFITGPGPVELRCEWLPEIPKIADDVKRARFIASYQQARDDFMQDVAQLIGGNVLGIEQIPDAASMLLLTSYKVQAVQ